MHRQANALTPTYDGIHKVLHWALFVLVGAQFAAGFLMPDLDEHTTATGAWAWHLGLGPTILVLAVLNLLWRILRPVPLPEYIPVWQRRLARAVHDSLYLLLIVIPLLGYAAASSGGLTPKIFGIVPLPPLVPPHTPWADTAGDIHMALVYVLLGLIGLHIAAALYHYLIRRDGVLERMLPGR